MTETNGPSIQEMMAQIADLQAKVKAAREKDVADAKGKILALVAEFGLTAQDIFPSIASTTSLKAKRVDDSSENLKKKKEAVVKFFNPATGDKWSGRGLSPKWIVNADLTPGGKEQYRLQVPVLAENLPKV